MKKVWSHGPPFPNLSPEMLLPYLRQLLAKGETHLVVSPEAREILRRLYKGELSLDGPPKKGSGAKADPTDGPRRPLIPRQGRRESAPSASSIGPVAKPVPQGRNAEEQIASLRDLAEHWPAFRDLGSFRKTLVFSCGPLDADLMFVGDTPGHHEEQRREPFAGPAGEKLDAILKAMGLDREQVYLTNVCKFRPALPGQTTNNRPTRPEEFAHSRPFVLAEIAIVKPKVIVALGATAAHALLENQRSLEDLRSRWHEVAGVPTRVTHHPSFLLLADQDALLEKRKLWEDLLVVMERLALPISKRQRGYFSTKL